MTQHLVIENLHKRFGSFIALKSVDLTVAKGELLVLLGPSGCGKTTLLRAIAGLDMQDSGRIVHAGKDISKMPANARDYGIVFQSYALFPNLTVSENVSYGLRSRSYIRKNGPAALDRKVDEMLQLVGLPGIEAKFPAQLSGGQQQRVALARALATSPDMLLLDEPLSALDAIERVRLRSEIRSLQKRLGVTTIMVTHDQEEALAMADRIVVMRSGHLEQIGTPRQIYEQPASRFVAEFIGRGSWFECHEHSPSLANHDTSPQKQSNPVSVGATTQCFVRPEDIYWADSLADEPHTFQAKVEKVEYLGAHTLVSLTTAGNTPISLLAQFASQSLVNRPLQSGSWIRVGIRPSSMRSVQG